MMSASLGIGSLITHGSPAASPSITTFPGSLVQRREQEHVRSGEQPGHVLVHPGEDHVPVQAGRRDLLPDGGLQSPGSHEDEDRLRARQTNSAATRTTRAWFFWAANRPTWMTTGTPTGMPSSRLTAARSGNSRNRARSIPWWYTRHRGSCSHRGPNMAAAASRLCASPSVASLRSHRVVTWRTAFFSPSHPGGRKYAASL